MIAHVFLRLSRRAALNLWRAPLPSLVSVLTIGLALFIGASFVLGLFTARALLTSWGAQASMTLYLDPATARRRRAGAGAGAPRRAASRWCATSIRRWRCKRLRVDLGELAPRSTAWRRTRCRPRWK